MSLILHELRWTSCLKHYFISYISFFCAMLQLMQPFYPINQLLTRNINKLHKSLINTDICRGEVASEQSNLLNLISRLSSLMLWLRLWRRSGAGESSRSSSSSAVPTSCVFSSKLWTFTWSRCSDVSPPTLPVGSDPREDGCASSTL